MSSEGSTGKLKSFMALAALINSTLDPGEIRVRAIEAATQLMDSEVGSLLLIDRESHELYFEVALGEKGGRLKEVRLKMGEGIAGWVAQTGEPVIVDDVQSDPRFFRPADRISRFTTRNVIAAPLIHNGKTLGVLQALNKREGSYSRRDLELFTSLADLVASAVENAFLYNDLRETFYGTTTALAEALEMRDAYTGGHTRRVKEYSLAAGKCLGLGEKELDNLELAAILHDIGKIGVRDTVLLKESPLSGDELASMNSHAQLGAEILKHIRTLKEVMPGVMSHHEKFDGSGYPQGLSGASIPLYARIIAVADTYDAMTTDRPYRKALSRETALAELRKYSGTQFDPDVVNVFESAVHEKGLLHTGQENS